MQPGQPPPPQSEHYGQYGNSFQQSVYSINAWQVRALDWRILVYSGK